MSHTAARKRETPTFLTVGECARALRVSEETIRRRFDEGDLRGVRLGSVRRILASELDRLRTDA
jgi:excisionase family DNA binding protein